MNMLHYRAMDYYEIALNYSPSDHAGDKRKLSQQCFLTKSDLISCWVKFAMGSL